ncbi:MAG: 1-deoxy-D-xylulose-5-phosphate reductoisomerase, partial [Candidatus Atribacteria bacterium]|nr:1-deoxy-D-xylulose-5-phosphate reductoisomerase [Candidatus Atribacteria bacterium]
MKVAILGSTGFLGTQILEVLSEYPDSFEICLLSGFKNYRKLREQIDAYRPDYAFLKEVKEEKINNTVFLSEEKLREVLFSSKIEGIFIASAGLDFLDIFAGLLGLPKTLWVASKELMIVAGEILKNKISVFANQNLIPLDSEHYALWSILKGMQDPGRVEKVYLTASGGPFYEWRGSFEDITPEMTLAHPNWKMGDKITVDSATLVNKGLEVIEAGYLFELSCHQIDVFVQRESYLHAGVRLKDGMYHMVMFPPDMRKVIRASL